MASKGVTIAVIALIVILAIGGFGIYQLYFASAIKAPKHTGVWQSLYITNDDGTTYWANAPKPYTLESLLESLLGQQPGGSNFDTVSTIQNNIYMNINETGISSWTFSCQEEISLTDTSGNVIGYLGSSGGAYGLQSSPNWLTVNANGQTVIANTNAWITGSTITATELQSILAEPAGNYYFVIVLANINLTLTVNGQIQTLTASSGTQSNVLQWLIQIN